MTFHLSHEQLCDHLLEITAVADPNPAALSPQTRDIPASTFHVVEDHLRACPLCAAELSSLQASLGNFQAATTSFANQELSLLRLLHPNRIKLHAITSASSSRSTRLHHPFAWAIAAGVVVAASIGAMVPRGLHRQAVLQTTAAVVAPIHANSAPESDQALLEEVDDDLSSSVPSAMQPLSDPTSTASSAPAQDDSSTQIAPDVTARKITHE